MKYLNWCILILITFSSIKCGYQDDKYRVGQVWNYSTRNGEDNSALTIVSIDEGENGEVIIGVHIDNIRFTQLGKSSDVNIHFLPFSKEAIDYSVTGIKEYVTDLPDFKTDYREWKNLYSKNQSKIFNSPVKQILDSIEFKTYSKSE